MSLPLPDIGRLGQTEYTVARPRGPIDLWLHGNEGPEPVSTIREELARLDPEILRRYPDPRPLEADLAARFAVSAEQVLVTAGADEAIDRFCRAFLGPDRNVVVLTPAFEMVTRYVRLAGAALREVPWVTEEFPTREVLDAVDSDTVMIVLATPSNPTGLSAPVTALRELSERAPDVWLFLDLVYADFLDSDPTGDCLGFPNAIVVRSFSKSVGLAGLRVGCAIGPGDAIAALRRAGGPYSVAGPSLVLARRALGEAADEFETYRGRIADERVALRGELLECGVEVLPSDANFVLARTEKAQWLWEGLASLGIAVRWFEGRRGLENAVRITCPGEVSAFERLIRAVRTILRPEALLFDMDGVLVDVSESYDRAIVETAASFGVTVNRAELAATKARGDANNDWVVTHRILAARGCDATLDDVTQRFEDAYQSRLWKNEIPTVTADWLAKLAERLRLGIVTGRPRRDAERFLSAQGLDRFFSTVICMEDAAAKPSPEPVERALDELDCERAWFLGDTVDDVCAARAAGAVPVGVLAPGSEPDRELETLLAAGAARVVSNLNEIESLLP